MAEATRETVLEALQTVKDPDTGKDIVEAGMIQGLVLKEGHIGFAIEVDPARGELMEPVRKAAEKAVYTVPGVLSVTAVLTAHSDTPGAPSQPRHAPHPPKAPAQPAPAGIPGVKHIIAVASGKGGVGKSTVAVNLALGLSALGRKVGLLDADIYGPSIPRMLGITGKPESDGKKLKPMERYGLKTMSIGFLVDEDTPMIWRGPMVISALTQMMSDVEWGELDVLVVDMPPGTGDAQLTMAQRVPLAGAVIVSTPQDIALIDARKGLAMFRKTQVPILGIVENMSMFVCPNCGHESHIFGHGGARQTAQTLECDFLGEVPLDLKIRETSDAGTPITAGEPESPQARAYLDIASRVLMKLETADERKAPKIVISD